MDKEREIKKERKEALANDLQAWFMEQIELYAGFGAKHSFNNAYFTGRELISEVVDALRDNE